jgi:hypothetical protein
MGRARCRLYQRHRWRSEGFHGEAKSWHGLARAVRRGLTNMRIDRRCHGPPNIPEAEIAPWRHILEQPASHPPPSTHPLSPNYKGPKIPPEAFGSNSAIGRSRFGACTFPSPMGGSDRVGHVARAAVRIVVEPLFEASFRPGSYGFRPKRGARQGIYDVRKWVTYGYDKVIDLDLRGSTSSVCTSASSKRHAAGSSVTAGPRVGRCAYSR